MWFKKPDVAPSGSPESAVTAHERRRRYEPTAAYQLAERVKRTGVELSELAGPWRAISRALRRPARNGIGALPIVTNGLTEMMVDTMEHAMDLAGLLNWSRVDDLDPVPDLVPPRELQLAYAG